MQQMIRIYRYGDYDNTGSGPADEKSNNSSPVNSSSWPLWEIFIRSRQGLDHKHVGSLHAADAKMAIENARDVYTRRQEGISIWVVESKHIHASNPDEAASLYRDGNRPEPNRYHRRRIHQRTGCGSTASRRSNDVEGQTDVGRVDDYDRPRYGLDGADG